MTTFDVLFLAVVGIFFVVGTRSGFVDMVFWVLPLITALLSFHYIDGLQTWLAPFIGNVSFRIPLSFVVLLFIAGLIAQVLKVIIHAVLKGFHLQWFNQLLGGCIGIVVSAVLLIFFIYGAHYLNFLDSVSWYESYSRPYILQTIEYTQKFFPIIPSAWEVTSL